jgi:hypothetical protein
LIDPPYVEDKARRLREAFDDFNECLTCPVRMANPYAWTPRGYECAVCALSDK